MGVTAAVAAVAIAGAGTAYSASEAHAARKDQEASLKKAEREAKRIKDETPKAIDPAAAARRRAVVSSNMMGRSDTILTGPQGTAGARSTILGG